MKTLEIIVGSILIFLAIWLAIGARTEFDNNFTDFSKSEKWITYTNTDYGYEISYPDNVEFIKSSELDHPKAKNGKENQVVFIGDSEGKIIHNMFAGSNIDYTANNIAELRDKYISVAIPQLINGKSGEGLDLEVSDFVINEIIFNDQTAIEVTSPLSYKILMFNKNGDVFHMAVSSYTGATTTEKDRNTRAIMETFRVLDQ